MGKKVKSRYWIAKLWLKNKTIFHCGKLCMSSTEHSSLLRPQKQVKTPLCAKKPKKPPNINKTQGPGHLRGQSSCKMDWGRVEKNCSVAWKIKIWKYFWKPWTWNTTGLKRDQWVGSQLGNTVGENVHRACALNDMKISEQHAQSLFSRECINYFRITTLVKYAINFWAAEINISTKDGKTLHF